MCNNTIRFCENCGLELKTPSGKKIQKRKQFCSQKCHDIVKYQKSSKAQREFKEEYGLNKYCFKGIERKIQLIELFGGKCEKCGYDKNMAALEFHHRDPYEKEFLLQIDTLKHKKEEDILNEAMKCMLLCANCHREIHSPFSDIKHVKKVLEMEKNKSGKIKNLY